MFESITEMIPEIESVTEALKKESIRGRKLHDLLTPEQLGSVEELEGRVEEFYEKHAVFFDPAGNKDLLARNGIRSGLCSLKLAIPEILSADVIIAMISQAYKLSEHSLMELLRRGNVSHWLEYLRWEEFKNEELLYGMGGYAAEVNAKAMENLESAVMPTEDIREYLSENEIEWAKASVSGSFCPRDWERACIFDHLLSIITDKRKARVRESGTDGLVIRTVNNMELKARISRSLAEYDILERYSGMLWTGDFWVKYEPEAKEIEGWILSQTSFEIRDLNEEICRQLAEEAEERKITITPDDFQLCSEQILELTDRRRCPVCGKHIFTEEELEEQECCPVCSWIPDDYAEDVDQTEHEGPNVLPFGVYKLGYLVWNSPGAAPALQELEQLADDSAEAYFAWDDSRSGDDDYAQSQFESAYVKALTAYARKLAEIYCRQIEKLEGDAAEQAARGLCERLLGQE